MPIGKMPWKIKRADDGHYTTWLKPQISRCLSDGIVDALVFYEFKGVCERHVDLVDHGLNFLLGFPKGLAHFTADDLSQFFTMRKIGLLQSHKIVFSIIQTQVGPRSKSFLSRFTGQVHMIILK